MTIPHHGFRDDPPPAPTAGYYAGCTGLPDCPVHSVSGVCPSLHPDRIDELAGIAQHAADVARTARAMGRAELAQHDAELAGIIGDMVAIQAEDNSDSLWTYLETFAAIADQRFRVHGLRLWCRDDGAHPGWSTWTYPDQPAPTLAGLVEWMREHWRCGEKGDG